VAGVPDLAVRQLAFDPDFEELFFEEETDVGVEIGDREDTALPDW
jgi:hypothetical protein